MAKPTPAAGGPSGSASTGAASSSGGAHPKSVPGPLQVLLDLFGHKIGNAAVAALVTMITGRQQREERRQTRLPNFGHIMTLLQKQNPIVFARICDLMQFLGNDADRADMQDRIAGIGGDDDPQPSVDFLVQLAGMAKSTGQAGLQEMKDYLTQLGYIGDRAEDQLEKAKRLAATAGKWAGALPGRGQKAITTAANSAANGTAQALSDVVTATGADKAAEKIGQVGATAWQRARKRWS